MGSRANIIKVAIIGDESSLDRATGKARKNLKGLDADSKSTSSSMASHAKAIAAAASAGAIAIATIAVKNGDELTESEDQLDNALDNMHQHVKNISGAVAPLQSQMEKWGYTNAQVDEGLSSLVRAGDSLTQATKDESIAANVAKGRHIALAAAEQLLVKVRTGHVSLLGRYGIATKDSTGKTISATKAVAKLAQMYKGSAATAAKSITGKTAALKAKFTDMTAHLGQKLIPILLHLGVILGGVADFFEHNRLALIALVAVVGTFVAAATALFIIDKVKMLTEAWTKAQAALDVVMDANPIMLVVAAVAALVAGVILAYAKVKFFHEAVDATWQGLQAGYHWIVSNWPLLLAILTGPFGLAARYVLQHRDEIVGFIQAVPGKIASFAGGIISAITSPFGHAKDWIGDRIHDIENFIADVPGKAGRFMAGVGDVLAAPFKATFRFLVRAWDDTVGKIAHGQSYGVGPFSVTLPDLRIPVPSFHGGGVTDFGSAHEGMAWLKNDEGVFTREQMAHMAPVDRERETPANITNNFPAGITVPAYEAVVRRQARQQGKRRK